MDYLESSAENLRQSEEALDQIETFLSDNEIWDDLLATREEYLNHYTDAEEL